MSCYLGPDQAHPVFTLPTNQSRSAILLASDAVAFTLAVLVALGLAVLTRWLLLGVVQFPNADDTNQILIVFISAIIVLFVSSLTFGHYSRFRPFWLELRELFKIVLIIAALDVFLLFIIRVHFSRLWFGFFLLSLIVIIPYGRELSKKLMHSKGMWYQPTYIVGTGDSAQKTLTALNSDSSLGHKVIGFIDLSDEKIKQTKIAGLPVTPEIPVASVSETDSQEFASPTLVFAFDTVDELQYHTSALSNYIASHPIVTVIPPPMGLPLYGAYVTGIFRHDTALLTYQNRLLSRWSRVVKRATDLIVGTFCLLLFSFPIIVIAILIKKDRGPIFFAHQRIGRDGRQFKCYKFRSMVENADQFLDEHLRRNPAEKNEWLNTRKLKNDPRITKIGAYLRKTSMDELPQLWNVLRGEMSLVGPRPVVIDELEKYSDYAPYYLRMTPGMSGLWQVSGRNETSYEERIRLDVWYSRNWSLWTDAVILIKTVETLIIRHGAY